MFSLKIALRYLFSKKTHNVVNVISLISVVGVAIATIAIVCVLSVFNGFEDLAAQSLSKLDPQLKILPVKGKVIANADSLAQAISSVDGVKIALPEIEEQAFAIYRQQQMPVVIKGVDSLCQQLIDIDSTIIDGYFMLKDSLVSYATLSPGVAVKLNARPGGFNYIGIYAPTRTGRINPSNPMTAFCADSLLVASVFQVNQPEYDNDRIILPIENARALLEYTTEAHSVGVAVNDNADINLVADAIAQKIGVQYVIKDRYAQQEQSFKMISIEKWITFLMLAFILVIASFNIISTLSMLIIEKDDNISTFNALGATPKMITRIFMLEGWLISMSGGVIGIIIGLALCLAQQWGHFIKLNGDPSQLVIDSYPVRVVATDLLIVFILVVAVGFITSQVTSFFTRRRINK